MKFSLKWLGDFIPTEEFFSEPEKLAERLTRAGLEVESVEDQKAKFQNVVVAKIESVTKHPQADRLTVCQVSTGSKSHSIVCGATNHRVGDKAVLALPGSILPGNVKIKKNRIRGVDSEGMLVSPKEMGFESKEEGIWILPPSAQTGKSFSQQINGDDVILDIAVPPNRSDCLSHKGLAREISCLFALDLSLKELAIKGDKNILVKESLPVEVKDFKACPRYCGRLIEGVTIKESPSWLKNRLKSLGLKSINNVVDIANFVLWDRGQPLHAFDRDQIQSLTVDYAQEGDNFLALDERELTLTKEDLAIKDKNKILALAGVIGGVDSGITEKTKNVFIESAGFAPEKIRKTVRRLGLETDSSYRFTRGIDLLAVKEAMDLACDLIQKEAGGKISKDFYDISHQAIVRPVEIEISLKYLEDRLGCLVSPVSFENWIKRLGCQVKSSKDSFKVLPPSYRPDLNIKEDLLEELARLEGYDKIPEKLNVLTCGPADSDPQFLNSQKLIHLLSGKGWYQALNYSFCDPEYYKEFLKDQFYLEDFFRGFSVNKKGGLEKIKGEGGQNKTSEEEKSGGPKRLFFVNNPISQKLSLMKPLLTPDLVRNMAGNFRRNNKSGRIFELSPVFYQEGESYKQELSLGLARWGEPVDIWSQKEVPNVYQIKSVLEAVFTAFGLKGWSWKPSKISFLHPGQTLALIWKNQCIGFVGSLHPQLSQKYKIPLDIALSEIHWEILDRAEKKPLKFKSFSHLLTLEKDLCFVIPLDIQAEDVRREMKKNLGSLCEKAEIFDIYEKNGERSVSFRMYLTPEGQSLTEREIQDLLDRVIQALRSKFSIHLK